MNPEELNNFELEQWAQRELKELPELKAPESLAPRILDCIAKRNQKAWYQRPFYEWNPICRILFIAICALLATSVLWAVRQYLDSGFFTISPFQLNSDAIGEASKVFNILSIIPIIISIIGFLIEQFRVELLIALAVAGALYGVCVATATFGFQLLTLNPKPDEVHNEK